MQDLRVDVFLTLKNVLYCRGQACKVRNHFTTLSFLSKYFIVSALSGRGLFFLIIKITLQDTYYNKYIHFTQGACDPTFENEQNNNPIF